MQDGGEAGRPETRGLDGRVALVTGGTRGIGAAIATGLARQGAAIATGYGANEERAQAFRRKLETETGATVTLHRGNIGSSEDCERVVAEVIERYGRLDILVNNAGLVTDAAALEMSPQDWDKVIRVNLSGAFFMSKPALGHMLGRGSGRIVNISSIIGETGGVGRANYAASMSGLFGLTRTLALEAAQALKRNGALGGPVGLTVNCVAPGFIETESVAAMPERRLEELKKRIPLGRLGEPEEVARVVRFLCADASSYITGAVWNVNGGMDM